MQQRHIKSIAGGGRFEDIFLHTVSVSNLLQAWNEFKRNKRSRSDVAKFELHLEDNIFRLHEELVSKTYIHDSYTAFYVCDPKRRHIHKATVRDRVIHQAMYSALSPVFEKHFIDDSYSSRLGKGTHAGVRRCARACLKVSNNWHRTAYVLKCDIRKFFDSIDHSILKKLLYAKIEDTDMWWLINSILESFEKEKGKGIPLGNVTSQLFENVYMNELDQFAKHTLKARYYFRYCDDFVIVSRDREYLQNALVAMGVFLKEKLVLELHPNKVEIRKIHNGVDFLGYVILPYVCVLRTKTRRRIYRKVKGLLSSIPEEQDALRSRIDSYLGVVSHGADSEIRGYLQRIKSYLTDR